MVYQTCNEWSVCLSPVQVESETAHSMQRLVELDSIKSRMLESQNALQVKLTISCIYSLTLLPPPPPPTSPSLRLFFLLLAIPTRPPSQEADNWTTLSADVEEVFSSQDIHKVTTVSIVPV